MNDELLGELLQSFNEDLAAIRKRLAQQPAPPDYRPDLERLTTKVTEVEALLKQATPVSPPSLEMNQEFEQQLRQIVGQEVQRNHPERGLTQTIKYGIWMFIVLLVLFPIIVTKWQIVEAQRDQNERSAWLWRQNVQRNHGYTTWLASQWRQDSVKFKEETISMEEQGRLLSEAQRKREEATALEKQATSKKTKR